MSHLDIEQPKFLSISHLWIQWKGTEVCCDIRCDCGWFGHHDGDFFYFFACPGCGQKYECGTHVTLHKLKEFPQGVHVSDIENMVDED